MRKKSPKTPLGGTVPDEAPARGRPGSIGPVPPKDPLVLAKSAPLHFRLTAKIMFASLLVLSPQDPLRWALAGPLITGEQDKKCHCLFPALW